MEKLLMAVLSIGVIMLVVFIVLGYLSHSRGTSGLLEGRLKQCPGTPNCVNSEFESDAKHYIEPLVYPPEDVAQVLPRLKTLIREMGGTIQAEDADYLAATFTSSIFRFVDDLEVRIDVDRNRVHLRSASRVGYGDAGVNRERVERLKKSFRL